MIKELTISNDVIKEHGITILTGEACALSMRLLCELTKDAMDIYIQYTGIPCDIEALKHSDYNDRTKYAVYMTPGSIKDVVIMSLFQSHEVDTVVRIVPHKGNNYISEFYLYGGHNEVNTELKYKRLYTHYEMVDDELKEVAGYYDIGRRYSTSSGPRRGYGNIHAMTGLSK